jgi:hypothetical protein
MSVSERPQGPADPRWSQDSQHIDSIENQHRFGAVCFGRVRFEARAPSGPLLTRRCIS